MDGRGSSTESSTWTGSQDSLVGGNTTASGIDPRVAELQRQLAIELKVKAGAEKLVQQAGAKKHLAEEAGRMLADSKDKVAFIRNQLLRAQQEVGSNGQEDLAAEQRHQQLSPLEQRAEELKHRLRIESAVFEGAGKVVQGLKSVKGGGAAAATALQQAQANLSDCQAKVTFESSHQWNMLSQPIF